MPKGQQFWKSVKSYSSVYTRDMDMGYHSKGCSICGYKPLYRAGRDAYCEVHKSIAVQYWGNKPVRVSKRAIMDYMPHLGMSLAEKLQFLKQIADREGL